MKSIDIIKTRQDFLKSRKNPIKRLLRASLDLFDARQTGILYGTNDTRIKCLPSSSWDRGIMDAFDGYGPKGLLLKWFGTCIVSVKQLSPVFLYQNDPTGKRHENSGIIAHVLRNCTDYYKKGISILICPDTLHYVDQKDEKYCAIPFYVYNGHYIEKSPEMIRADLRIVRQFQSENSIYIYLPDYGILVINSADKALMKLEGQSFVNEKDLCRRLDFLIEIVNKASLENLENLRGKQKAQLLWRKERHLRIISRELIENERKYRDLYQTAPIAYISIDKKGRILNCNHKAVELSGYNRVDLIGQNVDLFLTRKSQKEQIVGHIRTAVLNGRTVKDIQVKLKPHLKSEIWVNISIEAVKDQEGNVHELRAMVMDISERKKLEKQLFVSRKLEAIGRLSGGIAHDFNNILSPVSGYIEMLRMTTPKEKIEYEQMNVILECVNHAKELVSQLLTFSRQTEALFQPIDLSATVDESMLLVRSSLPSTIRLKKGVETSHSIILADAAQIRQLIVNLITRAFQSIGDQNGIIGIRLARAADQQDDGLPADLRNKRICLIIEDDGDSIDPLVFDRLFDPYFSVNNQIRNFGIGLSMVHGIVENHEGRITIENRKSRGNRFTIFFPAYSRGNERCDLPGDGQKPPEIQAIRAGTETILLVDDDKKVIDMLRYLFESLGYTVICFQEPMPAIGYLREHPDKFDIVITDQTMPGISGIELADHVALIEPELPVVICSGIGETLQKSRLKNPSIKGILKKPVTVKEMSALFVQLLD